MQLGRLRSNPQDYLAVLTGWTEEPSLQKGIDFSQDMQHIAKELLSLVEKDPPQTATSSAKSTEESKDVSMKFKETVKLNKGQLFFYKAGEHKLDMSS